MTVEQIVVKEIKKHISELPEVRREACNGWVRHFREEVKHGGEIAQLALALVGAELAAKE